MSHPLEGLSGRVFYPPLLLAPSSLARAAGRNVEVVVVGDNVGVGHVKAGEVGRRGIAGVVLVHKIAGALAACGASLDSLNKLLGSSQTIWLVWELVSSMSMCQAEISEVPTMTTWLLVKWK